MPKGVPEVFHRYFAKKYRTGVLAIAGFFDPATLEIKIVEEP